MGGWWLAQARHGILLSGRALFPGVPLQIEVLAGVPAQVSLRLVVEHDGQVHPGPTHLVAAGHQLELETPYPHDELRPGTYLVRVELLDGLAQVIERQDAGGYQLGRQWFSA